MWLLRPETMLKIKSHQGFQRVNSTTSLQKLAQILHQMLLSLLSCYLFPVNIYIAPQITSEWKGINTRHRKMNAPLRKLSHYGLWTMKWGDTTRHMPHCSTQCFFNEASLISRTPWMQPTVDGHLFWCSPIRLYYCYIHKDNATDLPSIGQALRTVFSTGQTERTDLPEKSSQLQFVINAHFPRHDKEVKLCPP